MIMKTEHDQKQCPNRQGGNRYRQQDYDQQSKSSPWKKNWVYDVFSPGYIIIIIKNSTTKEIKKRFFLFIDFLWENLSQDLRRTTVGSHRFNFKRVIKGLGAKCLMGGGQIEQMPEVPLWGNFFRLALSLGFDHFPTIRCGDSMERYW